MRPELTLIQLLDNYLHKRLSKADRREAEVRLLWDQELQQQLEAQKVAHQALRLAGRKQLRHELETIHKRLFG